MNINLSSFKKSNRKKLNEEENKNNQLSFPLYKKGVVDTLPSKLTSPSYKETIDSSIRYFSSRKERNSENKNLLLSNLKDFVENQTKNIDIQNPHVKLIQISNENLLNDNNNNKNDIFKHSRNISNEHRLKSDNLINYSNVATFQKILGNINEFEDKKKNLEKKKEQILLNINTLQKKILQIKDELEKNIINNTNLNEENINLCFKSEGIKHKQIYYDKDIPNLKLEIDSLKRELYKVNEENNKLNLYMYKLTTENNLECEDLTKINIEVKRKKEENKSLMNELIKIKEINTNLKLKMNNLNIKNNTMINSLNEIIYN